MLKRSRSSWMDISSISFHAAPGIGWRLHMSKIAAERRAVLPNSRSAPRLKRWR